MHFLWNGSRTWVSVLLLLFMKDCESRVEVFFMQRYYFFIFLNSGNRPVFVIKPQCVYREVGIEFLSIIWVNFKHQRANFDPGQWDIRIKSNRINFLRDVISCCTLVCLPQFPFITYSGQQLQKFWFSQHDLFYVVSILYSLNFVHFCPVVLSIWKVKSRLGNQVFYWSFL
jgi:hypothetical protein